MGVNTTTLNILGNGFFCILHCFLRIDSLKSGCWVGRVYALIHCPLLSGFHVLSGSKGETVKSSVIWPAVNPLLGEGNGNPLQYSCLENPVDRGAWRAAVPRVAQSQILLKWLSSSSSSKHLVRIWSLMLGIWESEGATDRARRVGRRP